MTDPAKEPAGPQRIQFSVPGLLADCCDGQRGFSIEAATVQEALERALQRYPLLRRHVYSAPGQLRRHVLIFYNDDNIAWLGTDDLPLKPGDRVSIVQAVSGG